MDEAASYAEFRRLNADQPDLLESVGPGDLPPSVRVTLDEGADVDEFVAWAETLDVFRVQVAADVLGGPSTSVVATDEARAHWTELASALEQVEGSPAWAAASAEVLRDVLDRGAEAVRGDAGVAERNAEAADLLLSEVARCAPAG